VGKFKVGVFVSKHLSRLGLLLALLGVSHLLLPNAWAEILCDTASELTPGAANPRTQCQKPESKQSCINTHNTIIKSVEEFKNKAKIECEQVSADTKAIAQHTGREQKESLASQRRIYEGARNRVESIVSLADIIVNKKIPQVAKENIKALQAKRAEQADPKQKAALLKAERLFSGNVANNFRQSKKGFEASDKAAFPANTPESEQANAIFESSNLILKLLADREKRQSTISNLQDGAIKAADAERALSPTPDTTPPPASKATGGPNLATLAALAGPAAGLASAMMQKKNASGLSEPTAPTASIPKAPTPNATSTKLAKENTNASNGLLGTPTAKVDPSDETLTPFSSDAYPGIEGFDSAESGISNGSGATKPGAGGFSSTGSGGSAAMGGGGEAEAKRAPATADTTQAEEALQSFGSGAGGLNFSGTPSDFQSSSPDEPMKEVLADMETAIDTGDAGDLFGYGKESQKEPGVTEADSGSLFPRVSAAYVRNLKRGFVLNGLGESIGDPESP